MLLIFLTAALALLWSATCDAAVAAPSPQVFSPVVLSELCQDAANYCIYVDQVRPGTVRASPVNATDAQGAFLFERRLYADQPFHVCYGGCCVDLDFATKRGCVIMRYLSRPSHEPGHLLARFADNVQLIIGPRDDMARTLEACPASAGEPLPYAVIGARSGHATQDQGQQPKQSQDNKKDASLAPNNPAIGQAQQSEGPVKGEADTARKMNHDYFDDVTVPLVDG